VSETRKRVLFVCIGNACRSQMAEAFARTYGSDALIPASMGLAPALMLAADTVHAMAEKNINIRDQFPKSMRQLGRAEFDLVVNMSGSAVPEDLASRSRVLEWDVDDPVFVSYERHCEVRDQIERLVMDLILELRRQDGRRGARSHISTTIDS
jgi:arsenate reductase (thioredoxin)